MEVDNNKVYTWANQPGLDFFGNDAVGKRADFYFIGKQNTYEVVQPLFNGSEGTTYIESWQKRKDGESRLLAWWCRTLKDNNGNVVGAISTARDITEQKKTEENILNSQRLLQRIIDLLPIRIFWKDKNLKYLGCNLIFAKDAGKEKPEDLIGKDDFQMDWKEQANIYRDDDQSVIKSGKSKLNFEEPQTTPTGSTIWLKTSKVPLMDSQGNNIGVLGSYEDITERKHAEEVINAKIEEVEKLNKIMVGRELKMVELKKQNEEFQNKTS